MTYRQYKMRQAKRNKRRAVLSVVKSVLLIAMICTALLIVGRMDFEDEACTPHNVTIEDGYIVTERGNIYDIPEGWKVVDGENYIVYFLNNVEPYSYHKTR